MSSSFKTARAAAVLAATAVVASVVTMTPAQAADPHPADPTFVPNASTDVTRDIVGVGSDTSHTVLHYLAEGHNGTPGYNAGRTNARIASFGAELVSGTTTKVTLRTGSAEINRPNGSGAGKTLLRPATNNPDVTFARSSSSLSQPEINDGLRQFPFAVDGLGMAVKASGSNAPANLTIAQILGIYNGTYLRWNQIPGNSGGSSDLIKPYIPQSGSGTRSFFETQLNAANGGTTVPTGSIAVSQEHDDTLIKNDPNAIAPFSTGRASLSGTVKVVNGFSVERALYNVVRNADASSPTILNIFGANGFVCSAAAEPLISAAGFDQLAPQSRGGVCGVATQAATTNLLTRAESDQATATTTTLTAVGSPSGDVALTATLTPSTATGVVEFYDGSTQVGQADVQDGGAILDLTGVAPGAHTYSATFVPSDPQAFQPSVSAAASTSVDDKYTGAISTTVATKTYGASGRAAVVTVKKNGVNATGTVTFYYGSASPLTATLVNGTATIALPSQLAPNTYWGAVDYAGDRNFTQQYQLVKFTATKAATTTKVTVPSSIKVKKTSTGTVTVAITGAPSTLKPSGTVTLKIGSTVMGTGTVSGGTAKVTIKALTTSGKRSLYAEFTPSTVGAPNYGSSKSSSVTYNVVK